MVELLNNIPPSGLYMEFFFEQESNFKGNRWEYVLFTKKDGEKWLGHFRCNDYNYSNVKELSCNDIGCIVAGGEGYLIDIENKKLISIVKSNPILDVFSDEPTCIIYIIGFGDVVRISKDFQETTLALPIRADGIKFKEVLDRKLFLEIEEIGGMETLNTDFYINLDDFLIKRK